MLCSECNKNNAEIFINKIENGVSSMEGLCKECAKKKGIDIPHPPKNSNNKTNANNIPPINNIDLAGMSKQLESLFKDLSANIKMENIEELSPEDIEELEEAGENGENPLGIPIGSIFASIVPKKQSQDEEEPSNGRQKVKVETKKSKKKKKFLDVYGSNLTIKAKNNELDMVIGRDKEIQRVVQILNRRTKNNPCLIGEPGVGKTAIAQGLAIKIANNNVPAKLLNKEVYLLDMTAVVAGTQFRGQFEARMKGIIDECREYGNIILVIDEIHNIIGAGDGEHSMNAANILKPSLSSGEIQIIGTTTLKEYRKYIEKDSALERRFQQVLVEEPNIDESIKILEGIKKYYEEYHKVKISNDVIKHTVEMSEKYIHDRFLPDKAIDILDEACSRINLENKELYRLEMLKQELSQVQAQKEDAANADSTEDYQKAADLKTQECRLIEEIDHINSTIELKHLTTQDIAQVIENWTKIPVKKITEAETQKLLNLETNLHTRIIGQEKAVSAVSRAIRRNRAGLQSTKRPPSFIFVGPTGVGKTELAKSLAYEMFGSEDSIIRIDMSEYMEGHSTSKLIGAPPGYVGYDDAGQLTEKVKRKPYSIILLDEIEKAHPDVFHLLLQVLDDGQLTDSLGRKVDFKNTIVIMTSNIGSRQLKDFGQGVGFGTQAKKDAKDEYSRSVIENALKRSFAPEFLNRIDDVIVFNSLERDDIHKIIDVELKKLFMRINEMGYQLELTEKAHDFIAEKGWDEQYGARPLKRAIQKYVEDVLAEEIIRTKINVGEKIIIDYDEEKQDMVVNVIPAAERILTE